MAEPTGTPSVWIGQEVHLEYEAVDQIRTDNCTLEGVNDGVCTSPREPTAIFTLGATS